MAHMPMSLCENEMKAGLVVIISLNSSSIHPDYYLFSDSQVSVNVVLRRHGIMLPAMVPMGMHLVCISGHWFSHSKVLPYKT